MTVLFILVWVLCAVITYGVIMHMQPDEWTDDIELYMFICLIGWWLFAILWISCLILRQLCKIALFFAGFLDKLMDKRDEK